MAESHLTYKTTREAIRAHEGRKLFCLEPAWQSDPVVRTLFMSSAVRECVEGPFPSGYAANWHENARAVLDAFIVGDHMSVGWEPFNKDTDAIIARVDPVDDEVWDFRCLVPRPGIRVFGRFAEPDMFIALTWEYRDHVDWDQARAECAAEWKRLFAGLPPHTGKHLNDYLTFNATIV
jgi:hypothetical protein